MSVYLTCTRAEFEDMDFDVFLSKLSNAIKGNIQHHPLVLYTRMWGLPDEYCLLRHAYEWWMHICAKAFRSPVDTHQPSLALGYVLFDNEEITHDISIDNLGTWDTAPQGATIWSRLQNVWYHFEGMTYTDELSLEHLRNSDSDAAQSHIKEVMRILKEYEFQYE